MITIDPILGSALVLMLVAAWYRVHKRWLRRCKCCGEMWRVSRKPKREFVHFVGNGKTRICSTIVFRCLNPKCKTSGNPIEEKSHFKVVPSRGALKPKFI